MQHDGHGARPRRHAAPLVAAALLLAAAAAHAQLPPDWPLNLPCGATATPTAIVIEAQSCWPGTGAGINALQAGTLTFDLTVANTGSALNGTFDVHAFEWQSPDVTYILTGALCPQTCEQFFPGLTVDVESSTFVAFHLDLQDVTVVGPIHAQLDNFVFTPATGFFDLGDDLDASQLRLDEFGGPLVLLGDVNGDGGADYALYDSVGAFSLPAQVCVVSGSGGQLISQAPNPFGTPSAAWLADVGDLDGDGLDDLAIGSPLATSAGNQGLVTVRSAATGAPLLQVKAPYDQSYFGSSVAGPGDVDLDGVPDVLIGAPEDDVAGTNEGRAFLVSGAGGGTLLELPPPAPAQSKTYGRYVLPAGDVNADGVPDLIVRHAATLNDVHVREGATGAVLFQFQSESSPYARCVVGGPDLDLDGHADIVVGRPAVILGGLHAYSGADGHELWSVDPEKVLRLGTAIAALGDVTGDGVAELLVGSPDEDLGLGSALLLSGSDGALVYDAPAPSDWLGNVQYGLDLDAGQDIDGDGTPDAIVVATAQQQLVVLSGSPAANLAPRLTGEGELTPLAPFALHLAQGLPHGSAVLVLGFTKVFLPFKGGFLQAKPDVLVPLPLDGSGTIDILAQLPSGTPSGLTFWMQSWHPDPSGLHGYKASNVLKGLTK